MHALTTRIHHNIQCHGKAGNPQSLTILGRPISPSPSLCVMVADMSHTALLKFTFLHVLPEFLLYSSFVRVVVTALRPLIKEERLHVLPRGVFGDVWIGFERILLECYTVKILKKVNHVNARRISVQEPVEM